MWICIKNLDQVIWFAENSWLIQHYKGKISDWEKVIISYTNREDQDQIMHARNLISTCSIRRYIIGTIFFFFFFFFFILRMCKHRRTINWINPEFLHQQNPESCSVHLSKGKGRFKIALNQSNCTISVCISSVVWILQYKERFCMRAMNIPLPGMLNKLRYPPTSNFQPMSFLATDG